jgi:hypothetical protein
MDEITANVALKEAKQRIRELERSLATAQARLSSALTRVALLERVGAVVRGRYR